MIDHYKELYKIAKHLEVGTDKSFRYHYTRRCLVYITDYINLPDQLVISHFEKLLFKKLTKLEPCNIINHLPKDILKTLDIKISEEHDESIFSDEELIEVKNYIKKSFYHKIKEL